MSIHVIQARLDELELRLAESERRQSRMLWPATVKERDHVKGVRFHIADDEDGKPVLSPWMQPPDQNVGTRSRWLPAIGSQHLVIQPAGHDTAMGFVPLSHNDQSVNPASDADDIVLFDDGKCRVSFKAGVMTLKAGNSKITIKDGEIKHESTSLKHNDKEVGDNHVHKDVATGPDVTGKPA